MEMAEIMEHRALKFPLVLYFFSLFFKIFISKKIKLREFKALKE